MSAEPANRPSPATSRPPVEQLVLCVDDDPDFLKSLEFFLPEEINRACGAGVWNRFLFFDNPREALRVLTELTAANELVAMVLSDQKMPEMKGTEFLAEAKAIAPDAIRVLLTGHAGMESAITAINNHLLDKYLTKPIENEHDFTLNIQHLLQRYQMQRTIAEQTRAIHALFGFSNALNALGELEQTLESIVEFTQERLRFRNVAVLMLDGGGLRVAAARGLPPHDTAMAPVRVEATEAPWCDLFRSRGAVLAATAEAAPFLGAAAGPALAPAFGAPLLYASLGSNESPIGFLCAGEKEGGLSVLETDIETMTYIASTASIALHNQIHRLQLRSALSDAKAKAEAIEVANARLEILDTLKSDFLTFISHELRTPLSLISAVGLVEDSADPADLAEVLRIARSGYERLDQFIAKGLEYLDWLSERHSLAPERIEIVEILQAASNEVSDLKGPRVDFRITPPDTPCVISGNRRFLTEVVRVLLENAVKFSNDDKEIRAEVVGADGKVRLSVSDRGKGFAPEIAAELFRPFTIADTMHHGHGTALSLAKASAIVEAHGGRIRAHSKGPGEGATFTIELPAAGSAG